jgi:Flp pilus assembly protein TadB
MTPRLLLLLLAASLAAGCWLALTMFSFEEVRSRLGHLGAGRWMERQQLSLRQADMAWLSTGWWVGLRIGSCLAVGFLAWMYFGIPVLGLLSAVALYQVAGLFLELRRRRAEQVRQAALLDAIRYGANIMSRAGNALQMVESLADTGPVLARRMFRAVVDGTRGGEGGQSLAAAAQAVRVEIADPLFDDFVLALDLHSRHGGRLVPALEALVSDWEETVRLQREAKAMRAGVEASVLLLSLLPFGFLVALQGLAPGLLRPFASVAGETLLAFAVAWMVLGYRVLQSMAAPPRQERVRLAQPG